MIVPVFRARVVDVEGTPRLRFIEDERRRFDRWLTTLVGKEIVLSANARGAKRSLDQNAWIWGVAYPLLAETLGYDRDEIEDMHYALVARCFGTHVDARIGAEVPNARSSKLTTKEFSEYMEWLTRFSAKQFNCVIPLPDEERVS